MQGKSDKKITVMTKTMSKKPQLEIITNLQSEPVTKSVTSGFSAPIADQQHYKTISTLASPKHVKPISEEPEMAEEVKGKKRPENLVVQKRGSGKQVTSPKVEVAPRMSANLLGSPKANMKDNKILISYGSQKNLNAIKPIEKRQTPQNKRVNRIQQLQKQLEEQKERNQILLGREAEVLQSLELLRGENVRLKEENGELKRKVEKYRELNEETKKMLKQRINTYNEEGGELQTLKNQIKTLEERVNFLMEENQGLKLELNKYSDLNISALKEEGNLAMSTVKEVTPLQGSRVSGVYLKDSIEGGEFKEFNGMDKMQQNLELQSYISEKEESYLKDHRANQDAFQKMKAQYQQILGNIELKYKNLMEDYKQTISSQAADIYQLELKLDDVVPVGHSMGAKMSLELDQMILKAQEEIATLNLSLFQLKARNKELVEEAEQHKAQSMFLQAELQISDIKKHFKDQNDNFEFNVVKLNLLTIIDKLKLKIDREKNKYEKLVNRVSTRPNP